MNKQQQQIVQGPESTEMGDAVSRRGQQRRRSTVALAAVMSLGLGLGLAALNGIDDSAASSHQGEQTYSLTGVSYAIPGTDPLVMSQEWADRVKRMTAGRVTIDIHPGGSLIGYGNEREGLTSGVIDISINAPMFFAGDDPAFGAWGLIPVAPIDNPARARHLNYQWAHFGGGLEIAREMYAPYNIHLIGTVHKSNEPVMSRVPLNALSDFQGLQVRAAPGLVASLFEAVGANPVAMGGGQIYSALDTGVVDAAEFVGAQENLGAGLHEVSRYALYPGFHSPSVTGDVTIRADVWDSMPEDIQLILEDSVKWLNSRIDHEMAVLDVEALARYSDEFGIELSSLSEEEIAEVQRLALEVTLEYRERSEMSARLIDSYLEHARRMGVID